MMDPQPSTARQPQIVRFKCLRGYDKKNIYVPQPVSLQQLEGQVSSYFREGLVLFYLNENDDRVQIRREADLEHALSLVDWSQTDAAVKLILADGNLGAQQPSTTQVLHRSYSASFTHEFDYPPPEQPSVSHYQPGTFRKAQLYKEPSRRQTHRHLSDQAVVDELFALNIHEPDAALGHDPPPGHEFDMERPRSPPPGFLDTDRSKGHSVSTMPFREVNGGGEFIPESDNPFITTNLETQSTWTAGNHGIYRAPSNHSLSSVPSGHGSQRSHHSHHSHSSIERRPIHHLAEDAESGFFDRESHGHVPDLNPAMDRYRSDTYPRISTSPRQHRPVYAPPHTLPRERAPSDGHTEAYFAWTHSQRTQPDGSISDAHSIPQGPSMPKNWKRGKLLGAGAFGQVYLALDEDTGAEIAMKQVQLEDDNGVDTSKEVRSLEDEIQLLRDLRHLRIVRYLGTRRTDKHLCIFMEYVSGRSIARRLKEYGPFPIDIVRKYTRQILEGLAYLHNNQIIHRDIKGANVLADLSGNIKLADFGAAKRLQAIRTLTGFRSVHGTPYWMAPEVVKGHGYGRRCDIWSVACTVIEMLTAHPPNHDCEPMAALFKIGSPSEDFTLCIPRDAPHDCRMFLEACFRRDPQLRPSANELLHHAFVAFYA
eukprot:m.153241 g.153241  ORF g.153241 m.153241 type:complete len:651 (-) comp16229_c4_seq1:204-2156(-)